tara:strand:- start:414 stop:1190 length:777 start_codon:yes stop_codon:yes gene_type:complete
MFLLSGVSQAVESVESWPAPLGVGVAVVDDASLPVSVSPKTVEGFEQFFRGSVNYELTSSLSDGSSNAGILASLGERCGERGVCWRDAVTSLGLDLLVRVELGFLGTREIGYTQIFGAEGALLVEPLQMNLPRGGGVDLAAAGLLFSTTADLIVELEPAAARLIVDGVTRNISNQELVEISSLSPGRHLVQVEGARMEDRVEVVTLLPSRTGRSAPVYEPVILSVTPSQWGAVALPIILSLGAGSVYWAIYHDGIAIR